MPKTYAKHIATLAQNGVTATNVQKALEDAMSGGGGGVTDHGALTGLADDDHTQYHNDARGDARYSLLGHSHMPKRTLGVTFDGGGSPPTAGSVGYVVAQFSGTVDRWDIIGDVSGNAVVDVWKAAGAIPTNGDRIAGTEKPTLSSQQIASDTSITTWTATTITAGDVLGFELESASGLTRVTCQVRIVESI